MVNGRLETVRSWLWPGHCLLCRARVGAGTGLCNGCHAQLPWLNGACAHCAMPLPVESASVACGSCQKKAPVFDRACAALRYAEPVDRLIVNLKYHRRLDLARTLGHLLVERLHALTERPDVIVPVPLHTSRLRERGYNQSLELARVLGRRLVLPVEPRLVKRVRATPTQTSLPLERRARNVRNAFTAEANVAGLHIAIVDDVMTSGYTVSALTKSLRRAGAKEISVWVVARA